MKLSIAKQTPEIFKESVPITRLTSVKDKPIIIRRNENPFTHVYYDCFFDRIIVADMNFKGAGKRTKQYYEHQVTSIVLDESRAVLTTYFKLFDYLYLGEI